MYILAMVVYMENVIRRYDGLDKTVIITKPYIQCQIGKISNHISQTIYAHIAHIMYMMVCQVFFVYRPKMAAQNGRVHKGYPYTYWYYTNHIKDIKVCMV
jgi:hypothetical protein